jgi:hypothetical protein
MITLDFESFFYNDSIVANHCHAPWQYLPCCQIIPTTIQGKHQENQKPYAA